MIDPLSNRSAAPVELTEESLEDLCRRILTLGPIEPTKYLRLVHPVTGEVFLVPLNSV